MPVGKSYNRFSQMYLSVLQVCKLNTNYAIKFDKCSGKEILPNVYQNMFLNISRELVKHSVVHGCRFTDYFTKEPYHWQKTHASVITLLMAYIVWCILIPEICGFSWLGKPYMQKKTTVKSYSIIIWQLIRTGFPAI